MKKGAAPSAAAAPTLFGAPDHSAASAGSRRGAGGAQRPAGKAPRAAAGSTPFDVLHGLNAAQSAAVTHGGAGAEGPLVVLAGPGTGKTKLIVHRVAHMILEKGVRPEQIVALTFTVKACEQLRQRVGALLGEAGPSEAPKANLVNIHTYHGLGHRLVRRFADRMGLPSAGRIELIDSAQRRRLVRSLIAQDGHMRSMLGRGVDAAAAAAMETIDALSDYAIDPAGAQDWAARWGAGLTENVRGLDRAALAHAKAEQLIFAETARLYSACQAEQRRRGWLSFGDLITWPLALLRGDALARDLVRGELRHGVVDEFQDVNQATIALLEAVFPPEHSPDLCVVGDDDQAIYAFRGADDRAFAKFVERWPGASIIKLEENYRSDDAVITLANATIGNAEVRFDRTKVIRRAEAKAAHPPAPGAATVAVLTGRSADNGEPITAMLLNRREAEPELNWSRIAVVGRNHAELDRVQLALQAEGIPVNRVGGRGNAALDDAGVKDLMAWARVLVNPLDLEHARRLLLRPPVSMSGPRLIGLLTRYKNARSRFEAGDGEAPGADGFFSWAAAECPEHAPLQNLVRVFGEFRERLAGSPAAELLFDLALRVDVVHTDLLPGAQRAARLVAVVSLLRFVFARQKRLDEPGDLAAFLAYFDDLDLKEQEGLGEGQRIDGADPEFAEADGGDDAGVVLITAHAAKGLEFDTVYVPKVAPGLGYPSSRSRDPRLPQDLLEEHGTTGDVKVRQLAEERRLFYVACTRAERRLVLIGNIPKSKSASTNFLAELLNARPHLPRLERTDYESVVGGLRPVEDSSVARELRESRLRKDRDATRDELAAQARAQAAGALERAFRSAVTAKELAEVDSALADAARTLAIIAEAHASERAPGWVEGDAALRARAGAVVAAVKTGVESSSEGEPSVVQPVRGPLTVSFTQINDFERCPGCWYVKHRLKLEGTPSDEAGLGVVVHDALCEFYGQWAAIDAEGDGRPLPDTRRLLEIGRRKYLAAVKGEVDRQTLERIGHMLQTAHEKLHGRDGNPVQIIERPEFTVRLTIPSKVPGGGHAVYAKVDRIERLPDGTVRIVDYKTGQDWKKYREPESDDLQMGIYTLALDEVMGGGSPLRGVAEYWLLATGEVGVLPLENLKRDRVLARINRAIDGMLSGEYPSGRDCHEGLCRLLRPGLVVDP
ncbi:MAG TPA: ATP-dependent DNA helicase [Phycisphaerales bacterium]|nr:ATP-dependent DNA helicase [Phycisphaerales bacterium]